MSHRWIMACVASLGLVGCAGAPRAYDPVLAAPPSDAAAFARDRDECRALAESEDWMPNGSPAMDGLAGAAVGVGVLAAATPSVIAGDVAVGSAGAAAIIVAPLIAYSASAQRRHEEELRINNRFAFCLAERGYQVTDWELARE